MLCDSVVVIVVRTHPRAIPLAMITMRKSTHEFPFLSYMSMELHLAALWAAGAPLEMLLTKGKAARPKQETGWSSYSTPFPKMLEIFNYPPPHTACAQPPPPPHPPTPSTPKKLLLFHLSWALKVGSWSAKIHLPSNDTVYCATFIPTEASYFLKLFVEIHWTEWSTLITTFIWNNTSSVLMNIFPSRTKDFHHRVQH